MASVAGNLKRTYELELQEDQYRITNDVLELRSIADRQFEMPAKMLTDFVAKLAEKVNAHRVALRLDPGNATAHAIKGFWRIWQAKSPAAARPHFDAALAAKQASPFADGLIIAAWMNFWSSGEPFAFGAVDYANRLRKLGRLADGEPSIARLHGIYVDGLRDPAYLARLDRVIPPADHAELLALLDKERLSNNERLATAALRAHYLAQAGAAAEARRLYEKVVAETPQLVDQKASDFAKAIAGVG